MAKSYYTYHDTDVNTTNPVTTVNGVVSLTEYAYNHISNLMEELESSFDNVVKEVPVVKFVVDDPESMEEVGLVSRADYYASGYSKCAEDDVFNSKLGLIIASRRTQLKATKVALKDVTEFRKKVEKMYELVKDMEDKLDRNVVKLTCDLAAIRDTVNTSKK